MELFEVCRIALLRFLNRLADTFRNFGQAHIKALAQHSLALGAIFGHLREPPLKLCLLLLHLAQMILQPCFALPSPAPRKKQRDNRAQQQKRCAQNKLNKGEL